MKLLEEFEYESDARRLSERLRYKGVMTFISSTRSHQIPTISRGRAPTVGLWAVLEHQYEDAFKLLSNKDHEVKEPLSFEEMDFLEAQSQKEFTKSFGHTMNKLLAVVFSALLLSLVSFVGYQMLFAK